MLKYLLLVFAPFIVSCSSVDFGKKEAISSGPDPDFHLFLLAGQSNMAGRGHIDPSTNTPHARILMLDAQGNWVPAVHPIHYDKPSAGVGLAKTFAEAVAAADPEITIGLIPAACGGSPIETWQPGGFHGQTRSHPYDDAVYRARRAMQDGVIKGILWHQGESDSNPERAPAYQEQLESVFNRFRLDLGIPELPIFLGQLSQFDHTEDTESRDQVNRAHQAVAQAYPNIYFIESDGLTSLDDKIHFDSASLEEFGRRYAERYLQVQ